MLKKLLPVVLLLATTVPAFAADDPSENLEKELLQKMPKHTVYSTMAGMLQGAGQYDKAIHYYGKLLEAYAEDPGKQSAKYAWALAKMAECYESKNDPAKAKENCTQCLQIMNSNKFAAVDELYLKDAREICENYDTASAPKTTPKPAATAAPAKKTK